MYDPHDPYDEHGRGPASRLGQVGCIAFGVLALAACIAFWWLIGTVVFRAVW